MTNRAIRAPHPAPRKLIGSMSARSSWQPDVQLEDDEPTFDVMEEVG